MARIRSIKPEFFTSLTIAELPVQTRLTFVGLWTYADDYGRGRDDARLVKAAVWPLDEDIDSRAVREDLASLSDKGLICRYEASGKACFHVTTWAEHQRVDRPTPSRLPECPKNQHGGGSDPHEQAERKPREASARASREVIEPSTASRAPAEQGARSKEQGFLTGAETAPPPPLAIVPDEPATAQTLLARHIERCKVRPPSRVCGHLAREIKTLLDESVPRDAIEAGLEIVRTRGLNPSTLASAVNEALNPPAPRASPRKVAANGQPGADPIELAQRAAQRKRDEDETERMGRNLGQAHRELPRPAAPADHA